MKDLKNNIKIFFKGFIMGIVEVIPGVSGATLALIMKIYYEFISFLHEISDFLKELFLFFFFKSNFKKVGKQFYGINFTFGVFLFAGMFLSIALFSNLMNYLITEKREYVMAFFFGLVLSSVSIPWGEIKKKTLREFVLLILSLVVFLLILSLKPYAFTQAPHPLYFFFGGILGICAMVLPGISGSFVFLLLGLYEFIIRYISNFTKFNTNSTEILSILFLAFGIIIGFSVFVRILKYALKNYSSAIFAILTGIIIASLKVLWPFAGVTFSLELLFLILLSLAGFGMVFFLKKLS